jgi:hypothetical protein
MGSGKPPQTGAAIRLALSEGNSANGERCNNQMIAP